MIVVIKDHTLKSMMHIIVKPVINGWKNNAVILNATIAKIGQLSQTMSTKLKATALYICSRKVLVTVSKQTIKEIS